MARRSRRQRTAQAERFNNRRHTVVEPATFDLLEEGIHLLRRTTAWTWICYLLGTGPFLVAFILFWNDMSHSGLAEQSLSYYAFGMALIYLWMKCWQCLFARQLRATLNQQPADSLTIGTILSVIRRQTTWHGIGLVCFPFVLMMVIPFPRVYGFLQNLTVIDATDNSEDSTKVVERSWRLSALWPGQSWHVVGIIVILVFVTFINWVSVIATLPHLLKMLFGVETNFVKSGQSFFNSTTFSTALALTYLTLDPLVKAVYLLRCHYGESVQSGADLRLALADYKRRAGKIAVAALVLLALGAATGSTLEAQDKAEDIPATENMVEPDSLDGAIDDTLRQREYIWRFPKEEVGESIELPDWIQAIFDTLSEWHESITNWFRSLFQDDIFDDRSPDLIDPPSLSRPIIIVLLVIAVVAIIYLAFKLLRQRKGGVVDAEAAPSVEAVPNLDDEDVRADSLPSNQWLDMARNLLASGDYRLALRAFFLAQLAHFAQQRWIVIQRFKSNRDYVHELSKRASGTDELLNTFRSEIQLFEGVWYGGYPVGQHEISEMERLLAHGGALESEGKPI